MAGTFFEDKELSRMGAVNALFSAFADKTIAFELNHVVQLFLFDDKVDKMCEFTNDMNMFIHLVDGASTRGCTSLYDALDTGVNSLLELR